MEAAKFKIKVVAESSRSEGPLLGLQAPACVLCPHMKEVGCNGERKGGRMSKQIDMSTSFY